MAELQKWKFLIVLEHVLFLMSTIVIKKTVMYVKYAELQYCKSVGKTGLQSKHPQTF